MIVSMLLASEFSYTVQNSLLFFVDLTNRPRYFPYFCNS